MRPPDTHPVLITAGLFEALADRVEWGEPDDEGFYTPTLYRDPAVLLRDTPEDLKAHRMAVHAWFCGTVDHRTPHFARPVIGWPCERADEIILAALREPRRYPESGEER